MTATATPSLAAKFSSLLRETEQKARSTARARLAGTPLAGVVTAEGQTTAAVWSQLEGGLDAALDRVGLVRKTKASAVVVDIVAPAAVAVPVAVAETAVTETVPPAAAAPDGKDADVAAAASPPARTSAKTKR